MQIATDDDMHGLLMMEKAVRRDAHKMKAFVRFREVIEDGQTHYVAWHRPGSFRRAQDRAVLQSTLQVDELDHSHAR